MKAQIDLTANFESDLIAVTRAMDSLCTKLGYKLVAKCYCTDKNMQKTRQDKGTYEVLLECFHYGNSSVLPTEGIIFSVESFREKLDREHKIQIKEEHLSKRDSGMSFLEVGKAYVRDTTPVEKLRTVDFHVYGGILSGAEGREVSTDFECKKLLSKKTLAQRINAPPVVKSIKIEQIMKVLQSKT